MKITITGAKGMLGSDLTALLSQEHDVTAIDIDRLDITKLDDVVRFFKGNKADVIINCAAYTNVDACETAQDDAFLLNAIGPRNLAVASNEANAPLVHISTDYIFDGMKGSAYFEHDAPNPLSVYGATKLAGEKFVKDLTDKYYIIRTQWLYGKNGRNFVDTMLKLSKERDILSVVSDQFGSPTYTPDLSAAIGELIKKPAYGEYHVTNSEAATWHEFACEIFKQAGVTNVTVNPCTTAEFPRPAKRPAYGVLENYMLKIQGYKPLRSFREALADYLK